MTHGTRNAKSSENPLGLPKCRVTPTNTSRYQSQRRESSVTGNKAADYKYKRRLIRIQMNYTYNIIFVLSIGKNL